ncbi:hypothetical protein KO481_35485 [Nocardia sp. NEAU-G5]|uniref:Uncharacterized protein n=1 Tax=Nocardia albiluteola TaxID=2842303 RepID=A0ABS6BC99_9NOCA|nr:hypothetical protein [Nocardia albiluteola]MBU3066809.1 hypothetical protein [Nocardia albiluteola]
MSINGAIAALNAAAPTVSPDPSKSQAEFIQENLTTTLGNITQQVKTAGNDQGGPSTDPGPSTDAMQKLQAQLDSINTKYSALQTNYDNLNSNYKALQDKLNSTPPPVSQVPPPGTPAASGPFDPGLGASGAYQISVGASGPGDVGASGPGDVGASGAGIGSGGGSGSGSYGGTGYPGNGSGGAGAGAGASGGGMDMSSLLGSILPMMMMSQAMNPNRDLNNQNNPQNMQPQAPQQVVPQAPPSQAPAQPGTAQPAPNGSSSSQPPLPPQGRTPGGDGSVLYTFDDGRTQKVSVVVAQALDAARANKDGTSAKDAYAKTAAKWSDDKKIGDAIDPSQLMTGDVATWDNHNAIVVVFPPGQGGGTGTLEVIVEGKLQPFSAQMSDKSGDFGEFAGFEHPHGIEMTGSSDPNAAGGGVVPVAADSSSGTPDPSSAVPSS